MACAWYRQEIRKGTDEQRPESLGADARDLCDVIHIVSSGDMHLATSFYTIEEMSSEWAFNRFMRIYDFVSAAATTHF